MYRRWCNGIVTVTVYMRLVQNIDRIPLWFPWKKFPTFCMVKVPGPGFALKGKDLIGKTHTLGA
jgi:hypothetical protein